MRYQKSNHITNKKENQEGNLIKNDWKKISVLCKNSSNPLNDPYSEIYNICNGLVSPESVNVQHDLETGTKQCQQLSASLTAHFHKILKK